jgi:organic hydroperoxide reductase OsmC/OhrA
MKITARVENSKDDHQVTLQTNDNVHSIVIPPKSTGYGSSASGGELLFLALATCYCNDIYREAAKRNINSNASKWMWKATLAQKANRPGM